MSNFSGRDEQQSTFEDSYQGLEAEERMTLLRNTDTLNRTSASLHRAQQISSRTSEIAIDVMDDLDRQKSTLLKSRNRLIDIDEETRRSRYLISTLTCKAMQNRLILVTIVVIEIFILIGVLFYKLYKKFNQ